MDLADLDSILAGLPEPESESRLPDDQAAVVHAFDQLLRHDNPGAREQLDRRVDELLANHGISRRPRRPRDLVDLLARDVLAA